MTENSTRRYGCQDYRMEMMLVGMVKMLDDPGLSESEKEELRSEIRRIKAEIGLD